jgi:NADPH:quinone reductase
VTYFKHTHNYYLKRNAQQSVSGGFVEYKAVDWQRFTVIPPSIRTRTAAAAFINGLTAYTFSTQAYTVKQNDWIFVHAAAGGVGLQLVQLAKYFGAKVIGTTSSAEKGAIAKEHGADHVIISSTEDVPKRVLEITGGKGVNAIYDGIGKAT